MHSFRMRQIYYLRPASSNYIKTAKLYNLVAYFGINIQGYFSLVPCALVFLCVPGAVGIFCIVRLRKMPD